MSKELRFDELCKVLESYGYKVNSSRGGSSHYTFRKKGCQPITIPMHEPIKRVYVELVKQIVESGAENDENGSLATLDWGRGVWTYDNTWYWGSGQMILEDGAVFGYNIGYGFGDTSAASENMLFYNGKAHKLEEVTFNIPKDDAGNYMYMKPWTFTSSDGRFEMEFVPVIDRDSPVDLKVVCMLPHQVFGRMSGKAILDDGKEIMIKDKLVFAERVHNKW